MIINEEREGVTETLELNKIWMTKNEADQEYHIDRCTPYEYNIDYPNIYVCLQV